MVEQSLNYTLKMLSHFLCKGGDIMACGGKKKKTRKSSTTKRKGRRK